MTAAAEMPAEATLTSEPVPAEAATAVDAAAPATTSPTEAAFPPDVSVSAESLPVDFASSVPTPLSYGDLAALGLGESEKMVIRYVQFVARIMNFGQVLACCATKLLPRDLTFVATCGLRGKPAPRPRVCSLPPCPVI